MGGKTVPKVNVRFVYKFCGDLSAMRHFYTDVLGMAEKSYNDEQGWLVYKSEGFELMFFRADGGEAGEREWAAQPGGGSGTAEITSWSVEVPEADFAAAVDRLGQAGVPRQGDVNVPDWRQGCYWGITVMDPAGVTVEVYTVPKEKPASTTWPGK
jgi:catechol 2,3-dioxygenase-like lactoylglutathione lyase family enzyme